MVTIKYQMKKLNIATGRGFKVKELRASCLITLPHVRIRGLLSYRLPPSLPMLRKIIGMALRVKLIQTLGL